jgi:hypothetical protein
MKRCGFGWLIWLERLFLKARWIQKSAQRIAPVIRARRAKPVLREDDMNCPSKNNQNEEILLDYCDGTLAKEQSARFEAHAAECPECREWIVARRSLWEALDEWRAPELSADFNARLYARIAADQNRGWLATVRAWLKPAWKPALVTATAGAALAVGLVISRPDVNRQGTGGGPSRSTVETVDMDQIEHALEDLELLSPGAVSAVPATPEQRSSGSRM